MMPSLRRIASLIERSVDCGARFLAAFSAERGASRTVGLEVSVMNRRAAGRQAGQNPVVLNGGDLYELAKILGHSNIKMTERYAKLARKHIAKTGSTAREIWKLVEQEKCDKANIG